MINALVLFAIGAGRADRFDEDQSPVRTAAWRHRRDRRFGTPRPTFKLKSTIPVNMTLTCCGIPVGTGAPMMQLGFLIALKIPPT